MYTELVREHLEQVDRIRRDFVPCTEFVMSLGRFKEISVLLGSRDDETVAVLPEVNIWAMGSEAEIMEELAELIDEEFMSLLELSFETRPCLNNLDYSTLRFLREHLIEPKDTLELFLEVNSRYLE